MDMTQIIMVSVLTVVTFWRKDIILYLITSPVLLSTGLTWFDSYKTQSGMVMALVLMMLGIYCFALGVYNMLKGKDGE